MPSRQEPRPEPRPSRQEPRPEPRPSRQEPRPAEEPAQKQPQTSHRRRKPGKKWNVAIGAIFVVFGVLAAYDLSSSGSVLKSSAPVSHPSSPSASRSQTAPASGKASPTASLASSLPAVVSPPASPSATPSAADVVARALTARSVAAFGPNGTSDGDNPGNASLVLAGYGANPWTSSWYATPNFGNLQPGTGLLLDMGHDVSVSSVKVVLGSAKGANVELRLGDANGTPADLSTVTSRSNVGGTVHLKPSMPMSARYVLIWFTKLPPDSAGTFQIFVYSITVTGH